MANCADASRVYAVKSTSEGNTFTYDANGNVLSGAGRTYTWNKDNRLDVVNGPGSAVMAYDYTGIRVKKTGTGGTTLYPFTGYEIQGSTITKHIRLGNEIVASRQGTARLFYHNDHLGGVNVISDINGARVQLNEYDPWGKVSRSEGNTDPNHRFTGQELDVESGIHYYGGRYYDQALGRFISPDPLVAEDSDPPSLNRYSYVVNNPQTLIDPSGHWAESVKDWGSDWLWGSSSNSTSSSSSGSGWGTGQYSLLAGAGSSSGNWLTNFSAGMQMAGGLAQMVVGGAACAGGITCLLGAPAVALGADQVATGWQNWNTGGVDSYFSRGIQSTGLVGQTGANVIDAGANILASFGAGAARQIVSSVEHWALQRLTTSTATKLAADPSYAATFLSPAELNSLNGNPGRTAALFGTATERALGAKTEYFLDWLSKPGVRTPDFASHFTGWKYDVMSNSARNVANHATRPYFLDGSTKSLLYPQLSKGWRF